MERDRFAHLEPDAAAPEPSKGEAPAAAVPQFTRALETGDEIPLDQSDRSIPYAICRNCGADNTLGVVVCHVCQGPLGGSGQREHDLEIAARRELARRDQELQGELERAAFEKQQAELLAVREADSERARQALVHGDLLIAKVRLYAAVGSGIVAALIPPVVMLVRNSPDMRDAAVALMVLLSLSLLGLSILLRRRPVKKDFL